MDEFKTMKDRIENLIDKAKVLSSANPDEALELSRQALSLSKDLGDKRLEAYSLISLALSYRVKSEIGNILDTSLEALNIFQELNDDHGKIKAMNLTGIAYFYSSMYDEAMKSFLSSLTLAKELEESFLESCILNNIAEIYRETLSYKKAYEYFEKGLHLSLDKGYNLNAAAIYGNMGDIHMREKRYEEALDFFTRGYKLLQEIDEPLNISEMETRIGRVSQLMGNKSYAEKSYIKALERLSKLNHKYFAIEPICNLASLYKEESFEKSMEYYSQAIKIAKGINANVKFSYIYKEIAELFEVHGYYKEALEYYKLYSTFNDKHIENLRSNRFEIINAELKHIKDIDQLKMLKDRFEEELNLQKLKLDIVNEENILLEKRASEDELTGIFNRRTIKIKYSQFVEKALKDSKSLAIYMLDIDNFKKYNDYWGHLKGDKCLIEISKCIEKISTSRGDIFGRYGGEEFVYLSLTESLEDAFYLGEKIRESVEKLGTYYEDNGTKIPTTISTGVVICNGEMCKDFALMFEEADKQLYISKRNGKNQVSIIGIS